MTNLLQFDFSGVPSAPLTDDEKLLSLFGQTINSPKHGFFRLPSNEEHFSSCQRTYSLFKGKKVFVHIGIGGSSLGAKLLIEALGPKRNGIRFIFMDNIDPDTIHHQLEEIDLKEAIFFTVSKSGNTLETMAILSVVEQILQDKGIDLPSCFAVATDPASNPLADWADKFNIPRLAIPPEVGGRYSVLSPVGLFPALFAGIAVPLLLAGARETAKLLLSPPPTNPLLKVALNLWFLKKEGYNQTVLMPYSSKLKELCPWFIQLWAESLGKEYNHRRERVNTGLTPLGAVGSTDQHGQMQLFMEGPRNKVIIFLEVAKFDHDFSLTLPDGLSSRMSSLMKAQFYGSKKALLQNKRPYLVLSIPQLNESSLGAIILFLESLTVCLGHLLEVNPFDQPGVELGKKYAQIHLRQKS